MTFWRVTNFSGTGSVRKFASQRDSERPLRESLRRVMRKYYFYLMHSSLRASVKCRFWPFSARFHLFVVVVVVFFSSGLAA